MPIADSAYTSDQMILGLYNDPQDQVLLAEYLLQTGAQQLGLQPAGAGGFGGATTGGVPDPGTTGGGQPPCFVGDTLVTLFNALQIPFSELYDNRAEYIGKGARSFMTDGSNFIVPGEIRDVYKTRVYEVLEVEFEDEGEPMRSRREHRFWTPRMRYKEIGSFHKGWRVLGFNGVNWDDVRVESKKRLKFPGGIDVYNLLIGVYHNYFAAANDHTLEKAVSNVKNQGGEGGGGG